MQQVAARVLEVVEAEHPNSKEWVPVAKQVPVAPPLPVDLVAQPNNISNLVITVLLITVRLLFNQL